ncbi:ABC transporter ATP-binding protein [Rhizobium sp. L43]|uniref:ABC transporter ATP-binding protein n=1 Tax=Rhizobium sp. L43 TaxID=2035452 RepID=UPI000BE79269|nr:ABC transporter ATP-binding protein [Rhizobium sp. L43]PDS76165.1 ABC transporter ATP-binding protein [Rhizobium sp. L43]
MNAISLDLVDMTKRFGALTALDGVCLSVRAGSVHALLGENGAGKSTLVKCLVGFYQPDEGSVLVDGRGANIATPKDADALGIGMVYQHFTLVPSMTVAENLVVSEARLPGFIDWHSTGERLQALMKTMPFHVPLNVRVSQLSAGEKQKAELIKQLYLGRRLLILDEPTSVLTPDEAKDVLGFVRQLTGTGELSAILITHKFEEVTRYADDATILRKGQAVRTGRVSEMTTTEMAEAMIGHALEKSSTKARTPKYSEMRLSIQGLSALGDIGLPAVKDVSLDVGRCEIVGVAGVSGNGQKELVEALMGQRDRSGVVKVCGRAFHGTRKEIADLGVYGLPQEPLKNACVPRMSLQENMALRNFDRPPVAVGQFISGKAMAEQAANFVQQFRVKAAGLDAEMTTLSGGNVQRAVLARELTNEVQVLIASNPTFGLDFKACEETRERIVNARNNGAAVLLLSEDLDELFDLADRIVVMSEGRFVYEVDVATADKQTIGKHMAGAA